MPTATRPSPVLDVRVFPPHVASGLAPLQLKALEFAHKRTQRAATIFPYYRILAVQPERRYIWVQGQGKPVHRVVWQGNYTCNCPDGANIRRCERDLAQEGYLCDDSAEGGTRGEHSCHLCCIHTGIITELVATYLEAIGDSLGNYLDYPDPVWAALPIAFPGLPTEDPTLLPDTEELDA